MAHCIRGPARGLALAYILICAALSAMSFGCRGTQEIRVVDGITREPLRGVQVIRSSYSNDVLSPAREQQVVLPSTDADGVVRTASLDVWGMNHRFFLDKDGYYGASVERMRDGVSPKIIYFSPADGKSPGEFVPAERRVTIPLYPRRAPDGNPN